MPKNNNFNILDSTVRPVYPTVGVLMSASGTDKQAEMKVVLGAYFDTFEDTQGLYVPVPDGSYDYFDIDVASVVPQGDERLVRFDADEKNYLIRPFYGEDGEWLSKYKIDLPKPVLEKMAYMQSHNAIEKFSKMELGDPVPFFEGLYCYSIPQVSVVSSLTYISSAGAFSRIAGAWKEEDITSPIFDGLLVTEIKAEEAKNILTKFDKNRGKLSVKEAKEASVEYE